MDDVAGPDGTVGAAAVSFDTEGVPVIALTGEIDMSNVDAVRVTIEPTIEPGPKRVIFDLRGLAFMDSSGIALLLYAVSKCGEVRLRDPSPIIRRVIEVTGLSGVLQVDS